MSDNVNVLDKNNEKVGVVGLNDIVYSYPVKEVLIKEYVLLTLANKRLSTACTKNRKVVSGGGVKPWKQKGTGRARAGSIRSPLWKGGGTVFGPKSEKNYKKDMPRKARKAAMKSALSYLLKEDRLIFIEDFELSEVKTKAMKLFFDKFAVTKALVILPSSDSAGKIIMSTRNLANFKATNVNQVNIVDLLRYEKILISVKANEELERNLAI